MTNHNVDKYVLSLYDFTGEALVPWAEAGYSCIAFDIQHDNTVTDVFGSGGSIKYVKADLHDQSTLNRVDRLSCIFKEIQRDFPYTSNDKEA